MKQVLAQRLGSLSIVLDNVYDPHNISAILRSCEAFGVQDVHIIESEEFFKVNKEITRGCEKWLSLHIWDDFTNCRKFLKKKGFVIYSTCFADDAIPINAIPIDKPVALVVGNEHRGVENKIAELCDAKIIIPMFGFVQSFNVSVASALALAALSNRLRNSGDENVFLTVERMDKILNQWIKEHSDKKQ